jgi:hypothetical protein
MSSVLSPDVDRLDQSPPRGGPPDASAPRPWPDGGGLIQPADGHFTLPSFDQVLTEAQAVGDRHQLPTAITHRLAILLWTSEYTKIALPWAELGHVVIPMGADKAPAVEFNPFCRGADGKHERRLTEAHIIQQIIEWAEGHRGTRGGLLLLGSHRDPARHLVAVDVDDPSLWPWVRTNYPSPVVNWSGRDVPEGAERPGHALFRAPPGVYVPPRNGHTGPPEAVRWPDWPLDARTPPEHWGATPIDVKAGRAYIVAPGSLHRSGRRYGLSAPLTADLLASLPVFDHRKYEANAQAIKEARWARKIERKARPDLAPSVRAHMDRVDAGHLNGDETIRLANGSTVKVADAARTLGKSTTTKCFCPNHTGSSITGNAGLSISRNGLVRVTCYSSCDASWTYSTPDSLPDASIPSATGAVPAASSQLTNHPKFDPVALVDKLTANMPTHPEIPEVKPQLDPLWLSYRQQFLDRIDRKVAKAAALDPFVTESAARVVKRAKDRVPERRRKMRAAGLDRRGDSCSHNHQAIIHASTGESMVVSHPCGGITCIVCGPWIVEIKSAAIYGMPIVDASGLIIGPPLCGCPEVHEIVIPRSTLPTWKRGFRRASGAGSKDHQIPVPASVPSSEPSGSGEMSAFALIKEQGVRANADILAEPGSYVVFDPSAGDVVTILSTIKVTLRGGGGLVKTWTAGDALQQRVDKLVEQTYSVHRWKDPLMVPDEDTPERVEVRGSISSCNGLHLRPDTVTKAANPSVWTVERDRVVSPARGAKLMKQLGIEARPDWAEDGVITSVTAPPTEITNMGKRMDLMDALESGVIRPPVSTPSTGWSPEVEEYLAGHLDGTYRTWEDFLNAKGKAQPAVDDGPHPVAGRSSASGGGAA